MNKGFIYLVALASGFSIAKAQTVQGIVTGKNHEPVEYATVVLQTPDSVYVNATYTDSEGKFSIQTEISDYRLIVQHVLYETYEEYCSDEYELFIELTEKENALSEIIVKGERPVVKVVDNKITYDMPLLLSGKAINNAYESMLQLPGVREQNGSLVLAGASSVTVIINGQVTSMPYENLLATLKMYPADMIQRAEIMYSAPPQYHIQGAAINLVLKGESSGGLQGQVNTAYTQKHYANYTSGISVLLPASKLTADFNYAYNRNQSKSGVDLYSNHLYSGVINPVRQFNRGNRKSNEQHIRSGINSELLYHRKLSCDRFVN
jgi:hypothetical protein